MCILLLIFIRRGIQFLWLYNRCPHFGLLTPLDIFSQQQQGNCFRAKCPSGAQTQVVIPYLLSFYFSTTQMPYHLLYCLARAAITKLSQTSWLKQQNALPHCSGSCIPEIKVLARLVSGEASLFSL